MIKINEYCTKIGAKHALDNKLYVAGWCFYNWFFKKEVSYIALIYDEDGFFGCCTVNKYCNTAGVFIKESHRGKGYGRRLFNYLEASDFNEYTWSSGCERIFNGNSKNS